MPCQAPSLAPAPPFAASSWWRDEPGTEPDTPWSQVGHLTVAPRRALAPPSAAHTAPGSLRHSNGSHGRKPDRVVPETAWWSTGATLSGPPLAHPTLAPPSAAHPAPGSLR